MTDLYVNFFHFQLPVIPNFLWQMLLKMENLLPCSSTVSIPLYRNPLSELQSTGTAWSQLPQWSDCLPAPNPHFYSLRYWAGTLQHTILPCQLDSLPMYFVRRHGVTPRVDLSSPLVVQTKANRQSEGTNITLPFRHQGAGAISSKICTQSHSANKVNS